jgi:hypothetical protein
MPAEKGYLVCRHGRVLLKQNEIEGGAHNVDVSTHCSKGQPVALVHTHNVNPSPSPQDIQTAKEKGLKVCVDFQGKVKCYKSK